MKTISVIFLSGCLVGILAQEPNPTQAPGGNTPSASGSEPIYRVNVVSRSTAAINFHHRQGSTKVDLRGTALMPSSKGQVRIESNTGATKLHVETDKMQKATMFGPEYLTFVLWAVSPEGNSKNLGELVMKGNGDNAQLDATTDLQAFGLIVTAEPYWAVSQPSDVVVMENVIRKDTTGTIETVDAKYQLLQRGQYTRNMNAAQFQPMIADARVPLQLREARSAIAIARAQGADKYAADTMVKANNDLQNAEGFNQSGRNTKQLETVARRATQMAEDARLISIRQERAEALAAERQAAADNQAAAEARARQEQMKAQQADADRRSAEQARASALDAKRQAEQARADAERMQKDAEAARASALAAQQQAQQDADAARNTAAKAEADKQALRAQLLQQLNSIMATRDTARGLIMEMSDVLFDTGKAVLRSGAREKLAKVSGVMVAYPALRMQIEGNTDNVGGNEYNQTLSEKRAFGVRDYLVGQGVDGNKLTAVGFGETKPVASNDNAQGRQQNRRVELVLSGDVIGNPANSGPTAQVQP